MQRDVLILLVTLFRRKMDSRDRMDDRDVASRGIFYDAGTRWK